MKTTFTKKEMMQRRGCYSTQRVVDLFFADNTEITIETILTSSIPIKDKRWFVYNSCDLTLAEKEKLSLLLAWAVLPIFEEKYPNDNRIRLCLEGIEKFNLGEITRGDLLTIREGAADAYSDAYSANDYAEAAASAYYTASSAYCNAGSAATAAVLKNSIYTEKIQLILFKFVKSN